MNWNRVAMVVFALWWAVFAVAETKKEAAPASAVADIGLLKAENAALRAINQKLAAQLDAIQRQVQLEAEGKKALGAYEETARVAAAARCKPNEEWSVFEGVVTCKAPPAPVPAAASPPKEK